jgi:hypothetical protein
MPLTPEEREQIKNMIGVMYVDLLSRHYALYEAIGQDLPGGSERLEGRMEAWLHDAANRRRLADRATGPVKAIVTLLDPDQPASTT